MNTPRKKAQTITRQNDGSLSILHPDGFWVGIDEDEAPDAKHTPKVGDPCTMTRFFASDEAPDGLGTRSVPVVGTHVTKTTFTTTGNLKWNSSTLKAVPFTRLRKVAFP